MLNALAPITSQQEELATFSRQLRHQFRERISAEATDQETPLVRTSTESPQMRYSNWRPSPTMSLYEQSSLHVSTIKRTA